MRLALPGREMIQTRMPLLLLLACSIFTPKDEPGDGSVTADSRPPF
jgi:hypothetical protein